LLINSVTVVIVVVHTSVELPKFSSELRIGVLPVPMVARVASRAAGLSNHEAPLPARGETSTSTSIEPRGSIEACAMSVEASATASAMVTAAIPARAMVTVAIHMIVVRVCTT
jgi:hypothetical protein